MLLCYCVKMFYNHTWICFSCFIYCQIEYCNNGPIPVALLFFQRPRRNYDPYWFEKYLNVFFYIYYDMMTRQYWMFIWSVMLRHGINSCQILFIRKDLQIDSLVTSIFAIWINAILLITQHLSNCCLAIMSVWNGYFIYLIFIK